MQWHLSRVTNLGLWVALGLVLAGPLAPALHDTGCRPQTEPLPHMLPYVIDVPNHLDPSQSKRYIQDSSVDEGWAYLYEETNGLPGLQRGGIGLLGPCAPPIGPCILYGQDPVNHKHCGHGPDSIIYYVQIA